MTRSDLIALASQAGFGKLLTGDGLPTMWHGADLEMLERFAGLVAAAEREACAEICDTKGAIKYAGLTIGEQCAAQIRARSNAE